MCFWGLGRGGVEICVLFNYISIVYFNPRHGKLPCVWLKYIEKIKDSRTTLFFYHVYFNPECGVFHHLGLKYTVEILLNNIHISTPLPAPSFVSARCGARTQVSTSLFVTDLSSPDLSNVMRLLLQVRRCVQRYWLAARHSAQMLSLIWLGYRHNSDT